MNDFDDLDSAPIAIAFAYVFIIIINKILGN